MYVILIFQMLLMPAAMAFEATSAGSFISGGKHIPFLFNPDISAVSTKQASAGVFADLGVELVASNLAGKAAGLPVIFPKTGGIGILTAKVLVKALSLDHLKQALKFSQHPTKVIPNRFNRYLFSIEYPDPAAAARGAMAISGQKGIMYSHPNFKLPIESRSQPDLEPLFQYQWHLKNSGQSGGSPGSDINVVRAWQHTAGQKTTIVAVIDLGFEQNHSDMLESWFINTNEIPGNNRDDDQNGLKDDISGWNFATHSANLLYGQNSAHGTATSGIIGSQANGLGTTGICPLCSILPIVIDTDTENVITGFYYAKSFNASVISNSWGYKIGTPPMDALVDAINDVSLNGRDGLGTSIVFAMSNVNRNDCRDPEPDISSLEAVIAVSSVDHNDNKVTNSGYGPCLDFVAPTSGSTMNAIATTDRPGTKGYNSGASATDFSDGDYTKTFYGTSAAAPQVAGALALIYSLKSDTAADEALELLKQGADRIQTAQAAYDHSGHSDNYGFGRINIGNTLDLLARF